MLSEVLRTFGPSLAVSLPPALDAELQDDLGSWDCQVKEYAMHHLTKRWEPLVS